MLLYEYHVHVYWIEHLRWGWGQGGKWIRLLLRVEAGLVVALAYDKLLAGMMTSGLIIPVEVLELIADYSLKIGLHFVLNLSATCRHFAAYLRKPAVSLQLVRTIRVRRPSLPFPLILFHCQTLLLPSSITCLLPPATSEALPEWLAFLRRQVTLQSVLSCSAFSGQRRSQSIVDLHIPRPPTCNSEGEWVPTPTYGLLSRTTEVRLRPISSHSGRFTPTEYSRMERLEWFEHEGTDREAVKRCCITPARLWSFLL